MFVKICGITTSGDARMAERAGANAIGMIFVSGSKRELDVERALPIAASIGPFVTRVGVFRDAPLDDVRAAVLRLRLDAVQLHGSEDPAYVAALRPAVAVLKALRFAPELRAADLAAYDADAILLDGASPGSGRAFAWSEAEHLRAFPRLILAGGLDPDNVDRAVAAMAPYAVDVASGVESSPGVKDRAKVRAFVARAREAGAALGKGARAERNAPRGRRQT
jgi:phosphoribosylanthranilate isomerase